MYIKRNITEIVLELLEGFRVVSINGPRQSGKTTLSKEIANTLSMEYYTFDDDSTKETAKEDPVNFINHISKKPSVIDETQMVPEIIPALKMSVDEKNRPGMFLLTGSADVFKMSSIKESLAGRMVSVNLFPLSNQEKKQENSNLIDLMFNQNITTMNFIKTEFKNIVENILIGGYPSVLNKSERLRVNWFETYIEARIEKDLSLIKRVTKENRSEIEKLLRILASNTSNILKYNSLAKHLNIKDMTVKSDIEILEALYLVRRVNPYFTNRGKREIKAPKLHFIDTGVVSSLIDADVDSLILSQREMLGNLVENYVYSELLKHTTNAKKLTKIYHYREGTHEVDLVLEQKSGKIVAIEIKSTATVKSSHLTGLVKLAENSKENFAAGYVFYGGDKILPISKDGYTFYLIPLAVL